MRALIQRVSQADVVAWPNQPSSSESHALNSSGGGTRTGSIGLGLLILLGVGTRDSSADAKALAAKIARLRIFSDADGKFNHSLLDVGGGALVVSQFTLFADTRKGRRPSFTDAARPETAVPLLDSFIEALRTEGVSRIEQGVFGAHMAVSLVNDGPVTIWLDSEDRLTH